VTAARKRWILWTAHNTVWRATYTNNELNYRVSPYRKGPKIATDPPGDVFAPEVEAENEQRPRLKVEAFVPTMPPTPGSPEITPPSPS